MPSTPRIHVIDENQRGRTLNDVMEIDHVIEVHEDGTVTDGPANVYAPNLMDDELDNADWSLWSHGYTGQHGYRGPIMHNSEYIGGRLADDIRATPGIYAAVAAYWSPDPVEVPDDFPVTPLNEDDPAADRMTCGTCLRSWDDAVVTSYTPAPSARCPFEAFHAADDEAETTEEGWAVVRLNDDARPDPLNGWTISGPNVHGMHRADKIGELPMAADSLDGIHEMIRCADEVNAARLRISG